MTLILIDLVKQIIIYVISKLKADIITLVIQVAECWIYTYRTMHSSPSNETNFSYLMFR